MNVTLPKLNGHGDTRDDYSQTPNKPGWYSCADSDGKKMKPILRCKCGDKIGLGAHHVHADGTITASFLDQRPDGSGCGWHVMAKLDGWDGGEMPVGVP